MTRDKESSRNLEGRPPKPMPPTIPDTPEEVARAILFSPPKREQEWKYLHSQERTETDNSNSKKSR